MKLNSEYSGYFHKDIVLADLPYLYLHIIGNP